MRSFRGQGPGKPRHPHSSVLAALVPQQSFNGAKEACLPFSTTDAHRDPTTSQGTAPLSFSTDKQPCLSVQTTLGSILPHYAPRGSQVGRATHQGTRCQLQPCEETRSPEGTLSTWSCLLGSGPAHLYSPPLTRYTGKHARWSAKVPVLGERTKDRTRGELRVLTHSRKRSSFYDSWA